MRAFPTYAFLRALLTYIYSDKYRFITIANEKGREAAGVKMSEVHEVRACAALDRINLGCRITVTFSIADLQNYDPDAVETISSPPNSPGGYLDGRNTLPTALR